MNFRVALQYEFTALHLDDCLERLGHHESDELAVQISAYVDNEFNVAELMEEAELKGQAMEQVAWQQIFVLFLCPCPDLCLLILVLRLLIWKRSWGGCQRDSAKLRRRQCHNRFAATYVDANNPVAGRNEMDDLLPTWKGVV